MIVCLLFQFKPWPGFLPASALIMDKLGSQSCNVRVVCYLTLLDWLLYIWLNLVLYLVLAMVTVCVQCSTRTCCENYTCKSRLAVCTSEASRVSTPLASFAMKGRPASILQTPNQNIQVENTQQVCVLHYTYSDHSQGWVSYTEASQAESINRQL